MSLPKNTRVEICPFRNGRTYSDYYAYDGFTGTVVEPTESGNGMWVAVDGDDEHRSGKKGLPVEILRPV